MGIRTQLVVSEAGLSHLTAAGITTGWISAWLQSAGAVHVQVHLLGSEAWKQAVGWQVFYARESELMRVALHHGRRIRAYEDGGRGLRGGDAFTLVNPARNGWHYACGDESYAVLLPLGDIAYQRERWLRLLNKDRDLLPLYVGLTDAGEMPLEPGLHGSLRPEFATTEGLMNDGGYLPEEMLMYKLGEHGLKVRFAESCTAGGLSERLSRIPGASGVLDCGWTAYSNEAKHRVLKVPRRLISRCGAVSQEVVEMMAKAGRDRTHVCVAVSGIAGPDGGDEDKPVGTVWIAVAIQNRQVHAQCHHFTGSRAGIRQKAVNHAFGMLASLL